MSSFVRTCRAPFLALSVSGRAPDRPPRILGTLAARAGRAGRSPARHPTDDYYWFMRHGRSVVTLAAVASLSGLLAATLTARPAEAGAVRLDVGPAVARTPLQRALNTLVAMPSGPPGVIVIVQHGRSRTVYRAGTASLARPGPPARTAH